MSATATKTETRGEQRERLEKDRQRLVLRLQELRLALDSYPGQIAVARESAIRSGDGRAAVDRMSAECDAAARELQDGEADLAAVEKVLAELLAEDARERQAELRRQGAKIGNDEIAALHRFGAKYAELVHLARTDTFPALQRTSGWWANEADREGEPPHARAGAFTPNIATLLRVYYLAAHHRNMTRGAELYAEFVADLGPDVNVELPAGGNGVSFVSGL